MGCNVAIDRAREASPQVTEEGPTRAVAVCKTVPYDWHMHRPSSGSECASANGFANQRKKKSVKRRRGIGALIAARGPYWVFASAGAGTGRLPRGPRAWRPGWGHAEVPCRAMVVCGTAAGACHPGLLALRSASGLGRPAGCGQACPTAFNRAGEKLRATGESCPGLAARLILNEMAGSPSPHRGDGRGHLDGCGTSSGQAASGWSRRTCREPAAPAAMAGSQLVSWTTME
jgi:hypothetical protein